MKTLLGFLMCMMLYTTSFGQASNTINVVNIVPTLGVAADSIGWVVGGIQTLSSVMRYDGWGGTLISFTGSDKKNNKPALDFYVFSQSPAHGTYTNHTAYVSDSTDMSHYLCKIHVVASDWTTQSTYATLAGTAYSYAVQATGSNGNLYVIIVATVLYTPTTTKDLTFSFGIRQN